MTKIIPTRSVDLRYKPELIGEKTIGKICKFYETNIPIHDIVLAVNRSRPSNQTLNIADIYAIINIAAQRKEVKQRKKFLETELKINDFVLVYRAWKKGIKPKEILALLPHSRIGVERVIRALRRRASEQKALTELKADASARQILSLAVPQFIDGRPAYVIFYEDIPAELIQETGLKSPELEEDILIEHRTTLEEKLSSGNIKHPKRRLIGAPDTQNIDTGPGQRSSRPQEPESRVIQTESEILSADVYKELEEAQDETQEQEKPKSIKEQLDEIL